jgi:two-component system sensor histidine kinase/response regulator
MSDGRVLIVDDDVALLEALSETLGLRMRELDVDTSESAKTALRMISQTDYDAIVADIKMPGMDGLELLTKIRTLRPDTPTLLITGHGEHDLAIRALRGGAHDYLQKPVDREYFVGALSHAIEVHRLSRQVTLQRQALQQEAQELQQCLEDRAKELRELYQREALARAQVESADRSRQELIAMVAHDLGHPLTTLRGYAELLGRPGVSPETYERARSIMVSETGRMARLVQDLVAVSHAATERFELNLTPSDLVKIAREQVELATQRSQSHTFALEAPAQLVARADADRLAQVFSNLLTNAVEHTERGEVLIRLWTERDTIRFSVSDQGDGIPGESLETIFEPRMRLAGQNGSQSATGVGLGLSIARSIVEAHDGRIWAENKPDDSGAVFQVALPAGRSRKAGSARPRRTPAEHRGGTARAASGSRGSRRGSAKVKRSRG